MNPETLARNALTTCGDDPVALYDRIIRDLSTLSHDPCALCTYLETLTLSKYEAIP